MKILYDTNIILDVLLQREPYYNLSSQLLGKAEVKTIEGWVCGTTVTTIHYLIGKALDTKQADHHINNLLKIFAVAPVNRIVIVSAIQSDFNDFEDAVLYQSAVHSGVEGVLTRNKKDFSAGSLPVYSPEELWNVLRSS